MARKMATAVATPVMTPMTNFRRNQTATTSTRRAMTLFPRSPARSRIWLKGSGGRRRPAQPGGPASVVGALEVREAGTGLGRRRRTNGREAVAADLRLVRRALTRRGRQKLQAGDG